MKINSLLESQTPSSSTINTTNSAPEFGRDGGRLEETTTSGSVASVETPLGGTQRRGKGSMFAGISTSEKYPNSKAVKEEQINEVDPRNFDSDEDYYRARNAPAKRRSAPSDYPYSPEEDDAYFREIFRKKRLAAQQAERSADHDRLATGTNESEMEEGQQWPDSSNSLAKRRPVVTDLKGAPSKAGRGSGMTVATRVEPTITPTSVKRLRGDRPIPSFLQKEGTVHQFPKKHKGDLSDTHDCPKCGGDLQSGKYMGHAVKVCIPCKQVYLPPNSGIDQQGNPIKEAGVAEGQGDLGKALGQMGGSWSGWYKDESADPNMETYWYDDGEGGYYASGTIEHNLQTGEVTVDYNGDEYHGDDVQGTFNNIGDALTALRGMKLSKSTKAPNYDRLGYRASPGPDDLRKTDRTGRKGTIGGGFANNLKGSIQANKGKLGPKGVLPEVKRGNVPDNSVIWRDEQDNSRVYHKGDAGYEAAKKAREEQKKRLTKKGDGKLKEQGVAEEKQRLDPKCWSGYKKQGTKMKGDTRVNNCVKVDEAEFTEDKLAQDLYKDLQIFKKGADKDIGSKAKDKDIGKKPKDKDIVKKTVKEGSEMKINDIITESSKPGLWANIHAKRDRIKSGSGERMRKPGSKGAPSAQDFKDASKTDEAANPAQQAAIAISMKKKNQKPQNENAEYDDEAGMADNNLATLERAVQGIDELIQSGDNLPEWCQEKIAVAKATLVNVWDYMKSEEETQMAESQFDMIEEMVESWAQQHNVDSDVIWEDLESIDDDGLMSLSEDWQKANKKDNTSGMSQKAVNAYRRENPGSKLKTAVTTKPSKLKKGSKASKRRKSFCARSNGQRKMHNIDCSKTPDKAICKARKRWNC